MLVIHFVVFTNILPTFNIVPQQQIWQFFGLHLLAARAKNCNVKRHPFDAGIQSRLDHFVDLGVETIWLSPIYKSPMADNGYDISDFRDIDPLFGTMEDFEELVADVHGRGIRYLMFCTLCL